MYHIALSKTKHLVFVNANPMSIQVQTTNLSGQLKILLPSIMLQRTDNQHKNVKKKLSTSLFNWSRMVQDSNQSCKEIGSINLLFMIE